MHLLHAGWKEGEGLGKDGKGRKDPIKADMYTPGAGLGSEPSGDNAIQAGDDYKTQIQKRARARCVQAEPGHLAFRIQRACAQLRSR